MLNNEVRNWMQTANSQLQTETQAFQRSIFSHAEHSGTL